MNGFDSADAIRSGQKGAPPLAEIPAGTAFVHRPVPLDAPISAAVLVRVMVAERAPAVGDAVSEDLVLRATDEWEVLDANCDLAKMRAVAADYAKEFPGREAVVVTYSDHCTAALAVDWRRP